MKLRSDGLKRMTRQMRAIQVEDRCFPPNEEVSERFILGELIGRGPFGEVYRAQDLLIDAQVALKVFAPELIAKPQDQERFLKVAHTARTLTQPNVVRVHSSGVHKDHAWVSMQALDGLSLRKVMKMRRQKREHFPLVEIEPILNQIIRAAGHVHREFPIGNLKPDNIILMPDLIKLTDHYVLAAFDSQQVIPRLAESRYLAPELRAQKNKSVAVAEIDPRCDIYSLGLMIGEMVFGPDYTPGATEKATSPLDALCRRACAQDPGERYESFEALSEDFSTLIDTGALLGGSLNVGEDEPTQIRSRPLPPLKSDSGELSSKSDEAAESDSESISEPISESLDIPVAVDAELATREYIRDSEDDLELGDLLATNEVPRDMPRAKKSKKVSPAGSKRSPDNKRAPKAPVLFNVDGAAPKEPTTTSVKPAPPISTARGDSGVSPGVILGGVLALLLIGAMVIFGMKNKASEPVELGDSPSASELAAVSDEKDKEDEAAALAKAAEAQSDDSATQAISEKVSAAQKEAERAVLAANDKALESAGESAAASEEAVKAEEDKKAASEAAALAATQTKAAGKEDGARPADVKAADTKAADKALADKKAADKAAASKANAAKGAAASPTSGKGTAKPADKVAAADGTKCKAGMKLIKAKAGNYCIDAYEYPGRGSKPKTSVSWFKAQQLCEDGGKRLCKQQEWRSACGGKYPYGSTWNPDTCNTVDEDDFERSLAAAGSFAQCKSRSGAYDMVGNAHEWVAEQRIAGGGYDSDENTAQCGYASPKAPGSSGSNIGFRCCADAE